MRKIIEKIKKAFKKQNNNKKIIIKFDDSGGVTPNVIKMDKIVKKYNLKVNWGVIGRSLITKNCEHGKNEYIKWIKKRLNGKHYEFFNHGYIHSKNPYEFFERPEQEQYHTIAATQSLFYYLFKKDLITLGTPANKKDDTTKAVLKKFPEIKVWLFGKEADFLISTPRYIDIEFPCGKVSFEKFKNQFDENNDKDFYHTLQGHPNMWEEGDFDEFVKCIQFLKEQKCEFIFPSDLLKLKGIK